MFIALNKNNLILGIVVLVAIVVRFLWLGEIPPSLNWDEVSHGYNAYSILKTSKDEWGNMLPIIFRAYGDYKLPVYIYLTALAELFFGLNYFSVRLISVIAGIGSVIFTYLLVKRYFQTEKIALYSALLMAVSPWSVFVSRAAFEANLALFFIIAGAYFFASKKFITSALLLGLSVLTYNSARVFVPLLLVSTFILYRREIKLRFWIVVALFILPMIVQLMNPVGQARYENLKIINPGVIAYLEEQRNISMLPDVVTKVLYNKPIYFVGEVVKNYIHHFSPENLFFQGSTDFQFNVPNHGLLYWSMLPFFYVGMLIAIKNMHDKKYLYLLTWLFLAPVASSVTQDAPHVLRSLVMLPIVIILISLAIERTIRRPLALGAIILFMCIQFAVYVQSYAGYRNTYSWSWQYGHEQAVKYISEHYDEYEAIVMTKKYGEPHEFILFYGAWEPHAYHSDRNLYHYEQSNWFWVDRFAKFYFINDWEIPKEGSSFSTERDLQLECASERCLLVTTPTTVPEGWRLVETIYFLDGMVAFEIYNQSL